MQSRLSRNLVTCVMTIMISGCYSTWDVTPRALVTLDGFHAPQQLSLHNKEFNSFTYDRDTTLRFRGVDGLEAEAQFRSIKIEGSILHGITREAGEDLYVNLDRLKEVQARTEATPAKKAVIVTTALLGTASVALGVLFYVASLSRL